MEPHPIPQNVTYFQFKLIGDMTLKQFLYLATGCGIAYVLLVFFVSDFPVIAWPLIIISAGLGASFAFLPIASRPLDYWLAAFLKAIYSPTKRA
ncbi:PrgI family protein, partial [Patescibacteria group bacterium]|nr:PrgI family protein [Patescibacteria group bacterium]